MVDRALAITGKQEYAASEFSPQESVMHAGVLFCLPGLLSQGLNTLFTILRPLPYGFYGLHHIVLILCFMALCRIKNPEQLKKTSTGEFGKMIGLDRIPQVEYFRKKVAQITGQSLCDKLHETLFNTWTSQMDDTFFYIDGHVRIYSGDLAHLPKHFVSRQKLCLSATCEFYVNTFDGLPLMVIYGELNEKLKGAIEIGIEKIKKAVPRPANADEPHFTLVFDREAYEPLWFIKLWEEHRVAVITYRKNVKDKWDENLFNDTVVQVYNNNVTMQLCEMGTLIQGYWFREIRKRSSAGHQTAIMTTHPYLQPKYIASRMFARWSQENFFKYLNQNFDFDKMIEYGTQGLSNKELSIPNPEYKQLTYQLGKSRRNKSKLEAKLFQRMEIEGIDTIESLDKKMKSNNQLITQIEDCKTEINELLTRRKNTLSRIKVTDMPEDVRFNKLKVESKKLKNIILMIAYRAESALYGVLPDFYRNAHKDGRTLLKEIFLADADLLPDYQNKTLTIRLHSLSTPRANEAVKKIANLLNQTQTIFPATDLKLIYETVAL